MNTPYLETERLILRTFRENDAESVYSCWESDEEVSKYMFWECHSDINKTIAWIAEEISNIPKENWYRWAITLKETGDLIGTCLIYYEDEYGEFEVSYNLGKKYWGFGYITEALQAALTFAKNELGIKKIMGRHAKENPSSGNVLKKLGFIYTRDIPYECNHGKNVYIGNEYVLEM